MKRFLVTGATGFVGRHVVENLQRIGDVVTLGRTLTGKNHIFFDITKRPTPHDFEQLSGSFDAVIHLASLTQKKKRDTTLQSEFQLHNADGTRNLLALINTVSFSQLIYVSTLDVYGDASSQIITEDTPTGPITPYGASKLDAEHVCEMWARKNRIPLCIARLGLVYGPGEDAYQKLIPECIQKALQNDAISVYGKGDDTRDYIYVSDVARALELLIEKKSSGIYNVVSGQSVSVLSVAQHIVSLTKSTGGIKKLRSKGAVGHREFDSTKLRKLGFVPETSLLDGLKKEIAWFARNVV